MFETFITQMTLWHWLVVGGILIAAEILFFPGGFLLWLGLGSLGAGLALMFCPNLGLFYQFFVFFIVSLFGIFIGRHYYRSALGRFPEITVSKLSTRSDSLIGRDFTLDRPIVHGRGRIRIGDVYWLVYGPDLPAGIKVHVIGIEGNILCVEPL